MEFTHVVNSDGQAIPVKVVNGSTGGGGITGKDVDNNEQIHEVSFEVDDNGYPVLRTIDAAPFAYNPISDTLKTSKVKVKKETLSQTLTLDGNKNAIITFAPPVDKLWRINTLFLRAPAVEGATTGTHSIAFRYGDNLSYMTILEGTTSYDKMIEYKFSSFADSTDTQIPTDKSMQSSALKDILISRDIPLHINYQNRTDVAPVSDLILYIVYSEENSL